MVIWDRRVILSVLIMGCTSERHQFTRLGSGEIRGLFVSRPGRHSSMKSVCLNAITGMVPKLGTTFMRVKRSRDKFVRQSGLTTCIYSTRRSRMGRGQDVSSFIRRKREVLIRIRGSTTKAGKPELSKILRFSKSSLVCVPGNHCITMSGGVRSDRTERG